METLVQKNKFKPLVAAGGKTGSKRPAYPDSVEISGCWARRAILKTSSRICGACFRTMAGKRICAASLRRSVNSFPFKKIGRKDCGSLVDERLRGYFTSLKSELGPGPVFHRLDRRIGSQLLIAALPCHPAHLVGTRLKAQGIHSGRALIRERMRSRIRIIATLRRTDGIPVASR